jgi:glycosyltransferase involved in cell wall biosynthesis
MPPAVSIVLPARNEEHRLPVALGSLMRQTLTDWELVVVDDGSTDRTAQVAAQTGDERVRVVSIAPNGIAGALNVGIAHASAPLVARQDADDRARPERLERQVAFMRSRPDVAVLGTNWAEFGPAGEQVRPRVAFIGGDLGAALQRRNVITHSTVVLRRDVVLGLGGYDETLRHSTEDWDLWLRVAGAGWTLWNLEEALAERGMTGENTAFKIERAQVAEELLVRWREIGRHHRAGRPIRPQALHLARRAPVVFAPLALKRAVRRAQGKA